MPVGTVGSVKSVPQQSLLQPVKAQIILGNTYHLFLRPGLETLEKAGGLHRFINWPLPILTDSGGFQVYSLSKMRKISVEGVRFASHIDGSYHLFSPQNVAHKQRVIGSDIMMALDECTPYPCEYSYAEKSMQLTHKWAAEGRKYFEESLPLYGYLQYQFGIVQGSTYPDLRKISAEYIASLNFEGNAIGGLAVGEPAEVMYEITAAVCQMLPPYKPRYLMGVGTPANILESIACGVDMMDCVLPTRNARHGLLYTWEGIRNIKNACYKNDFSPIDPLSSCDWDHYYTKAYLRHLFISGELLGLTIASIHNLNFFMELVSEARKQILNGTFLSWKNEIIPRISQRLAQ